MNVDDDDDVLDATKGRGDQHQHQSQPHVATFNLSDVSTEVVNVSLPEISGLISDSCHISECTDTRRSATVNSVASREEFNSTKPDVELAADDDQNISKLVDGISRFKLTD